MVPQFGTLDVRMQLYNADGVLLETQDGEGINVPEQFEIPNDTSQVSQFYVILDSKGTSGQFLSEFFDLD